MLCSEEKNAKYRFSLVFLGGIVCAFVLSVLLSANTNAQPSTSVNATICASSSSVTITQPMSDSVIVDPTVAIRGTVTQASQIEVLVDGVYDGVIPLDVGQSTYESQVQLSTGTHTITLKAIDYCQSADSVATTVVTYTPPPGSSSVGDETETIAGDNRPQGVVIGGRAGEAPELSQNPLLPVIIVEPLQDILRWLNIASYDSSTTTHSQLSLPRAVAIGVGAYVLLFGLAANVIKMIATLPMLSAYSTKRRLEIVSRVTRIAGAVLLLAGLLL